MFFSQYFLYNFVTISRIFLNKGLDSEVKVYGIKRE